MRSQCRARGHDLQSLIAENYSHASSFLYFLQLLKLRFGRVIFVQRIAATDHAVARGGGAIAEGAADRLGDDCAGLNSVGEDGGVTQGHSSNSHQVRPTVADHVLSDM